MNQGGERRMRSGAAPGLPRVPKMTTTMTSAGSPPRSEYGGPLRFGCYRDGARVMSFELVVATAIGPESVPVPGEVVFRDGLLVVNRKDEHAAGVALLWDAGPL